MSVNKVILVGHVGSDPENRSTQNQLQVCKFSLATNERKRGPDGSNQDHTEWHNIVCFGKTAEIATQYVTKGKLLFLEGKISTRKYQDQQGVEKYFTEIIANNLQMLGSRSEGNQSSERNYSKPAANNSAQPPIPPAPVSFEDDDIPF